MLKGLSRLIRNNERGNWITEFDHSRGFVVRNKISCEEYHFLHESEGWITSKHGDKALAFSTRSLLGGAAPFQPVLVDEKSMRRAYGEALQK